MTVRRTLACTLLPSLLLALAACGVRGASDYNKGVEAGRAGSYGSAVEHYTAAIAANPEFTEAWYNRGNAELHLAWEAALAKRDADAAKFWRACTADKKKAKELMDRGVFFVLPEGEREAVKAQAAKTVSKLEVLEKLQPDDAVIANALRVMPEPEK